MTLIKINNSVDWLVKSINTVLIVSVVYVLMFLSLPCQASADSVTTIDTVAQEALNGALWVKKADMPSAGICKAVNSNGRIYTFKTNEQYHITVEEYDPKMDKWVKKNSVSKNINKGVFGLASIAGKIYIAGGYNAEPISFVEEYNPSEDSWSVIKRMPIPVDCCSAVSADGKLYVIGGVDNSDRASGAVQEYDPGKNCWTLKTSMPTPRSEIGLVEVKGKIYAIGGNWGSGREVEEYDPVKDSWTRRANMNNKCVAFQAAAVNGKIYVVFRGTIQEYDTITNKWTSVGNGPDDKVWLNGATSIDGKLYILGGLRGEMKEFPKGELLKTVWQYDPSSENIQLYKAHTSLKKILDKYAAEGSFNGAVLVAKDGNILISGGYGKADIARSIPVTAQTRFSLASISKQFTAMAIMQLQEKGLLNVTDPITKYFKGYNNWKNITIHDLLNHTSGITTDVSFLFDAPVHSVDVLDDIKDEPLEFKPGSNYRYCNTGYNILGFIIEMVTGEPYEEYVTDNIFNPLGMTSTGCAVTASFKDICAKGYSYNENDGILMKQDIPDLYKLIGCCNIYSNVEDMYKWGEALYTEKLVKKDTLDKIFTPGLDNYANGWFISTVNGRRIAFHGGGCDGVNARMIKYMDENAVIVLLSNVGNQDLNRLVTELESALFD